MRLFALFLLVLAVLPLSARTEYERYFADLENADIAADRAWDGVSTAAEFDARRAELRAKLVAAVGGFPERTPLRAKVAGVVRRNGYHVEKVHFESRPGFHVTANVFVPDAAKFKAPYPAVLVPCGHAEEGKACPNYQRACVLGASEGFLMMVYDPIGQGERRMSADGSCCDGHNLLGSKAIRLGLSAAQFRLWDGIRAIDYLQSRPDVRPDRIGAMGNSGGGTMTALLMAVEPRLRAACPSCYISSIRAVVSSIGPQDAEQCVYGQLRDGINHASLVLMADAAVRLQFSDGDFFPIAGSLETFGVVSRTAARVGRGERFSRTVVRGAHGWKESSCRSSLDWMRQWLMDEPANGRTDADYTALDEGFDEKTADMGLSVQESNVTADGRVAGLPGERSDSDVLVDGLLGPGRPRIVFRDEVCARHRFYGAPSAGEENAMIAGMLGRDLVLERKAEILEAARVFAVKNGCAPFLVAEDSWVRPARCAYGEAPGLFAGFVSLGEGRFQSAIRGELRGNCGSPSRHDGDGGSKRDFGCFEP